MVLRKYADTKVVEILIPVADNASTSGRNLRYLLQLTYPDCPTFADMANASRNNKAILPTCPAVAHAAACRASSAYCLMAEEARHLRDTPGRSTTTSASDAVKQDLRKQQAELERKMEQYVRLKRISPLVLDDTPQKLQGAIGFTPRSTRQALQHPSAPLWRKAMDAEMEGLHKRGTISDCRRRDIPPGAKVFHMMFVFADKTTGAKARCVLRGNDEDPYPAPHETYAGTPTADAVRFLFAFSAQHGYELFKRDVNQAFTQSKPLPPEEYMYAYPPPGYSQDKDLIYCIQGALYGWAKAPAYWAGTLTEWLLSDGWRQVVPEDPTLFKRPAKTNDGRRTMDMFLQFHVDDIALSAHPDCSNERKAFDKRFMARFSAKDEGKLTRYIGLDVHQVGNRIYVTQAPLVAQLLEDMQLADANPTLVPMQPGTTLSTADRPATPNKKDTKFYQHIVGGLQFLTTWTRPDIGYAVHELSKHQSNPGDPHMQAVKTVVRHLKGTYNYGPVYGDTEPHEADRILGFADSNWAQDTDTRKSINAHFFRLNRGPVSWMCKQQQSVATSTTEAEYMSASAAAKKAIVLRRLAKGFGIPQHGPTPVYEDNRGCQLLSESAGGSSRTRHIDVALHNVRQLVQENVVRLLPCPTADMTADILTKALSAPLFRQHRDTILGYTPLTAPPAPPSFKPWPKY